MSALPNRGVDAYRRHAAESASPVELVVMLYDGALRFAADARAAIVRRDVLARSASISKMLGIVGELQATLDMERGGSIATSLDELYSFVTKRLLDAAFEQNTAPLDEAIRVLSNLREGWTGIRAQGSGR
jgi:flagellar protein FliS